MCQICTVQKEINCMRDNFQRITLSSLTVVSRQEISESFYTPQLMRQKNSLSFQLFHASVEQNWNPEMQKISSTRSPRVRTTSTADVLQSVERN
jgi:hypothetical protein